MGSAQLLFEISFSHMHYHMIKVHFCSGNLSVLSKVLTKFKKKCLSAFEANASKHLQVLKIKCLYAQALKCLLHGLKCVEYLMFLGNESLA